MLSTEILTPLNFQVTLAPLLQLRLKWSVISKRHHGEHRKQECYIFSKSMTGCKSNLSDKIGFIIFGPQKLGISTLTPSLCYLKVKKRLMSSQHLERLIHAADLIIVMVRSPKKLYNSFRTLRLTKNMDCDHYCGTSGLNTPLLFFSWPWSLTQAAKTADRSSG